MIGKGKENEISEGIRNIKEVISIKKKVINKCGGNLENLEDMGFKKSRNIFDGVNGRKICNENDTKDLNNGIPLKIIEADKKDVTKKSKRDITTNNSLNLVTRTKFKQNNENKQPKLKYRKEEQSIFRSNTSNNYKNNVQLEKSFNKTSQRISHTPIKSQITEKVDLTPQKKIVNTNNRTKTPNFDKTPQKLPNSSLNINHLTREYNALCKLEQQKLQKLSTILAQKEKIDTEFFELIKGKISNK